MGGEQCHMIARPANGTTKITTARTAEDAPATPITGTRPMARIKIPIDQLPDAPEPTLPHRQREKIDTFTLSWGQEQLRRKVVTSERQKKWRRKSGQA